MIDVQFVEGTSHMKQWPRVGGHQIQELTNVVAVINFMELHCTLIFEKGAQWLSGRVLDSRLKGRWFQPHQRHCIVSLSKNLVLVQQRKTRPFITKRLLMGRKESNETNKIF